ncbi:hypothetical protein [Amycolatopsis pittospori]|uniref:hypothetical protein n=1 Tax=Amycolatopsis pittospori TaxID=2749434 RepID=UPI001F159E5B|nr:hypothetical protein [Amycolatopsis pittospori]
MPPLWALWILAVFIAGVWLIRAAGCAVNDYADRGFDGLTPPLTRPPSNRD